MANTNIFEDLLLPNVPHSNFDLSHDVKLTTNFHRITPILCQECLPGDRWKINTRSFLRTQPLLSPVMDKCSVDVRFFFVPNRIIWDDFEEFITGGKDGTSAPITPHILPSDISGDLMIAGHFVPSSLVDYLGYPVSTDSSYWSSVVLANPNLKINSLPLRAFAQIWNDYYQDRNFLTNPEEISFSKASGNEVSLGNIVGSGNDLLQLRNVAMLKDYFTSALPFAQRGQQVTVPLFNNVPVTSVNHTVLSEIAVSPVANTNEKKIVFRDGLGGSVLEDYIVGQIKPGSAPSISINELRELSALQRYYETNARGGSRYVEQLLARWNVVSEDSRLQRAEYLGGSRAPLVISEVMQQTPFEGTSGEQPLGTLGGKAVSVDSAFINHYCYEHGWLIGLMYLRPENSYYQGMNKQFTRMVNTDYYLPEFANLGEQEIKRNELYLLADGTKGSGEETFGYTPRYSEYKWLPNRLCGDMKGNLKFWSYARELDYGNSSLNSSFIRPTASEYSDVFAVQDSSDKIIANVNHHIQCRRSMPMFPVPELK